MKDDLFRKALDLGISGKSIVKAALDANGRCFSMRSEVSDETIEFPAYFFITKSSCKKSK